MTADSLLHSLGGFAMALPWSFLPKSYRLDRLRDIDLYAYNREWQQNLAGENPNDPMSPHQIAEAKAWGVGARRALRLVGTPYPAPYPA
jgi:hypothetical protein